MGASPFFTAEEIQLAQDRLPKREPIRLTFRNVWKVVTTQIYVGFSVLFAFGSQLEVSFPARSVLTGLPMRTRRMAQTVSCRSGSARSTLTRRVACPTTLSD